MSSDVVSYAPRPTIGSVLRPGLVAVRRLWRPFVLIQVCAGALVGAYFLFEPVRHFCQKIADVKTSGGFVLSAVMMALGPGLLPEVFKYITGTDRTWTAERRADIAFNLLLFAILGVIGDAFYRLQVELFGDRPTIGVIAAKVSLDQFVYSPFISLPLVALLFTVRRNGWNPAPALGELGPSWYLRRVVSLLVACWAFWIPMSTLMYTLPGSLTFSFCCLASAAWALVMVAVASHEGESLATEETRISQASA